MAKGDVIVFVDADTLVPAATLYAAVEAIEGGAVGGGAEVRFEGAKPLFAEVLLPGLLFTFRAAKLAAGCFIFCTRDAYEASGGFDESLFGSEEISFSRALGRIGRFVILRQEIITSGRKLRAHSPTELMTTVFRLALAGSRALTSREGLDLWYGERREDPAAADAADDR